MSEFLRDASFYTRDSAYLSNYVRQMAIGLSIEFGITVEEAVAKIQKWKAEGRFTKFENPTVDYFTKDDNDDRIHSSIKLTDYIATAVKNKYILVPTFTAYFSPEERKSPLSEYIGDNVDKRSKLKKASQKAFAASAVAKAKGDLEQAEKDFVVGFMNNSGQTNKKENNNSLSGLFSAVSSIFCNDTGHNTLTSITRSMASIANALNERIIGGNRHYRDSSTAINNTLAIIESTDLSLVRQAMDLYGLRAPSVDELMDLYRFSMQYYSFDISVYKKLLPLVSKLNDEQRAIVAYSQDLFHMKKFNPEMMTKLLTDFAMGTTDTNFDDPVGFIRKQDELTISFAHQVCLDQMRGKPKSHDELDPALQQLIAKTCANINSCIAKYKILFEVFFLTKTVPNSSAFIQDMVRTSVVLSDTDSTMFSVDQWVQDYFGFLDFSSKGFAVAGTVAFISSQVNAHCIAILSGNMGVSKDRIFKLSMKPEFVFPVFIQSPVAKHYFTAKLVCEGVVYNELDMEIKGVHNRNSAVPEKINKKSHERMLSLIETVMEGKKISLKDEINSVIDLEQELMTSLISGSTEFYKRTSIKTISSYKVSDPIKKSLYAFHTMWMEVFSPIYGPIPEPDYEVIKIPTRLTTKTRFKKWLETFDDKEAAERLRKWMEDHNKTMLKTIYLSTDYVEANGIPKEIISIANYDKIILDLTNTRRMLLDSIGYTPRPEYLLNDN